MNEIIEILMRRDCLSENEALNIFNLCLDEVKDAVYDQNYDAAVEAVEYWLGLEPDYLDIILNEI